MSGTAELLGKLDRKEITLRDYERLCGLPPMEGDEDLQFEVWMDEVVAEAQREEERP